MSVDVNYPRSTWPLTGVAAARTAPRADGIARTRLNSVDLLRGLVMVVMALDHTRDFFGAGGLNPRDVADPALFMTRWVTHFCAPIFIFLAGVSAYLYGTRGRSTAEVSRFLFTRGFWLIVLEFTLVRLGWTFGLGTEFYMMQVIWAIGASMVALSALVWLPRGAILAIAVAMIAGHNLLDGIHAADFGSAGWLWNILHEPALLSLAGDVKLRVLYPLIPWIGVMAAGYTLGPAFTLTSDERVRLFVRLGLAITAGFLVLRLSNVYGDPAPWARAGRPAAERALGAQCREVSAVAALPDDDARAGPAAARRLRARGRKAGGVDHHVRPRAAALLRGAHLPDPRVLPWSWLRWSSATRAGCSAVCRAPDPAAGASACRSSMACG